MVPKVPLFWIVINYWLHFTLIFDKRMTLKSIRTSYFILICYLKSLNIDDSNLQSILFIWYGNVKMIRIIWSIKFNQNIRPTILEAIFIDFKDLNFSLPRKVIDILLNQNNRSFDILAFNKSSSFMFIVVCRKQFDNKW